MLRDPQALFVVELGAADSSSTLIVPSGLCAGLVQPGHTCAQSMIGAMLFRRPFITRPTQCRAPSRLACTCACYFDTQAQRRRRVVALPLVLALVEPGSRYSLNDPRIEPSPPPPSRRSRRSRQRHRAIASNVRASFTCNDGAQSVRRTATCRRYRRAAQGCERT